MIKKNYLPVFASIHQLHKHQKLLANKTCIKQGFV